MQILKKQKQMIVVNTLMHFKWALIALVRFFLLKFYCFYERENGMNGLLGYIRKTLVFADSFVN